MDAPAIIQSVSSVFAMAFSIFAVIRSSKAKQTSDMNSLERTLVDHASDDLRIQTELTVEVKNLMQLTNKLDHKLDEIRDKL